jgi:predicted dehydrogenase
MRVGIAGVGFMGGIHAASWSKTGAEIAGFVASNVAHAKALAGQYGATAYPDLAAMLAEVDVVDLCTPTHLHHAMTLQAAAAGKHVVCEKPLARALALGQEMIRACQVAGVQLLVAHVVRFFPEYVHIKTAVEQGQIGRPGVIRLFRRGQWPRKREGNWFLDFEKSGGIMLDLMIHDVDYARWLAGDVTRVFAKNLSDAWPQAEALHALVILTHRSGAISHIEASWAYPPLTFWTGVEVAGSDGLIQHDSASSAPVTYRQHSAGQTAEVVVPGSPLHEDPYTTQIKAFYQTLLQGTPPVVTARDGLAALQIGLPQLVDRLDGRRQADFGQGI